MKFYDHIVINDCVQELRVMHFSATPNLKKAREILAFCKQYAKEHPRLPHVDTWRDEQEEHLSFYRWHFFFVAIRNFFTPFKKGQTQ